MTRIHAIHLANFNRANGEPVLAVLGILGVYFIRPVEDAVADGYSDLIHYVTL